MSVVLSEHLPLLASAPDGIQKLRRLILELAVRGKLVPQDPDDEPASELLKRIAKERARLEAAGRCKKSKALPPVNKDEKPFALPHTWAWTRLGEITNFGQTDKDGEISDTTWVLDLEDIQKDTSVLLQKVRFSQRQAKSDKNRFLEGDVLYGKLRPYLNKVIVADEEGVCTTEILPVRGYLGIFPRYLMYAVKRPDFLAYVNAKSYGMKMPRLGTDDGRLALFPLAPEKEQHRIVAKVDELMALCDRLEAEQADAVSAHAQLVETLLGTLTQSTDAADLAANWQHLAEHFDPLFTTEASIDALKQAVLQLAVMGKLVAQDSHDEPASELLKRIAGERARLEAEGICKKFKAMPPVGDDERPFDVPNGWIWERVGNYVIQTDYGLSDKTFAAAEGVPVLKMGDIKGGHVVLGGQKAVPPTTEGLPYLFLEPDDLLYNRTNSAELVGKTGIFRGPAQQYSFASYLIRIRCANGMVSPTFLNFAMNAPMFRETEIVPHLKQQCGQANVNGTILRSMRIPVPPAAEQHRIVAKVDELMAICERLKADLGTARQRQATLAETLIESALEAA